MNCEGVWSVEIGTGYGWERIATAFMKNGEYLAASAGHYSIGTYTQDGEDVEISANVKQYADLRTVFGLKTTDKLDVISKCKLGKNEMTGKTRARGKGKGKGKKKYEIVIRFTRLETFD